MTREDIIRMAWEAGFIEGMSWGYEVWEANPASLERFAALVAAHEREACAQVCDEVIRDLYIVDGDASEEVLRCAKTIRARGEVKP